MANAVDAAIAGALAIYGETAVAFARDTESASSVKA
jgi:hypothetical protein